MVKELAPEVVKQALVIKGVERIESIVTREATREPAKFYTWQCSRLIRRDYYLMCCKMFLLAKKETAGKRIERRLHDLAQEGRKISELATMPAVLDESQSTELTIRIVSPEARMLLNLLVSFDRAMATLLLAHGTDVTMEKCAEFFAAYGRLKQALFKAKPEKVRTDVPLVISHEALAQHQPEVAPSFFRTNVSLLGGWMKRLLASKA